MLCTAVVVENTHPRPLTIVGSAWTLQNLAERVPAMPKLGSLPHPWMGHLVRGMVTRAALRRCSNQLSRTSRASAVFPVLFSAGVRGAGSLARVAGPTACFSFGGRDGKNNTTLNWWFR